MKVNEGLVFHKHTCNLPVLAKSMMDWIKYSRNVKSKTLPQMWQHILMVQGLCTSLGYPYAHFANTGATADELYPHRLGSCAYTELNRVVGWWCIVKIYFDNAQNILDAQSG